MSQAKIKIAPRSRVSIFHLIGIVFVVFAIGFVTFFNMKSVHASWTGESFVTQEELPAGTIVVIDQDNPDSIRIAEYTDTDFEFGVVTPSGSGLVTYTREDANTSVALDGEVGVLVNNADGDIKQGDAVGISWLKGVGMRYEGLRGDRVFAIALEDANFENAQEYGSIETPDGDQAIRVQRLNVRLIAQDALPGAAADQTGFVATVSSIIGKQVSAEKVIMGTLIFVLSVIASIVFTSSSIRGSFISIGRNPMASSSIFRSLVHVTGVSTVIVVIGAVLAYIALVV